jgi:hypothetical protein
MSSEIGLAMAGLAEPRYVKPICPIIAVVMMTLDSAGRPAFLTGRRSNDLSIANRAIGCALRGAFVAIGIGPDLGIGPASLGMCCPISLGIGAVIFRVFRLIPERIRDIFLMLLGDRASLGLARLFLICETILARIFPFA